MKPEDQLIAIAQAHGYTDVRVEEVEYVDVDARSVSVMEGLRGTKNGQRYWIPRYLSDLNASHEAIKTLTPTQRSLWAQYLHDIVDRDSSNGEVSMSDVCSPLETLGICANATAPQRACAFLQTLGLWREET